MPAWLLALAFGLLGLLGLGVPGDLLPVDMSQRLLLPSVAHPLGTDWLGRDLLLRVLLGTRAFFLPGLAAALIALFVGGSLGALGGYAPEKEALAARCPALLVLNSLVSALARLLLQVLQALPRLVSLLLVFAVFGFEPWILALTAGLLYAGELGEALYRRVRTESAEPYVTALRAEGVSDARVLGYHILWQNGRRLLARHLCYAWAFVVTVETTLSFLPGEFGLQEPTPSWGNMLQGSREASLSGSPWSAALMSLLIAGAIAWLAWLGDRIGSEARR